MPTTSSTGDRLKSELEPIIDLIHRHHLVESLVQRQDSAQRDVVESLVERQHLARLQSRVSRLHPADIAHLLEMLPPAERLTVWNQVPVRLAGEVLWEVADSVTEHVIGATEASRLVSILLAMDTDDLGHIATHVPPEVLAEVKRRLDAGDRSWVEATIAYPDDSVGYLMGREMLTVPATGTLKTALRAVRQQGEVPEHTDKLFVVDETHRLVGVLPLSAVLRHRLRSNTADIMTPETTTLRPEDDAEQAAQAFERYDLVSAPVVDEGGRLVGRLTVDVIMDYVREAAEEDALGRDGLRGDEDLLAPVLRGAKRRWLWLALNLTTAIIASRVIGVFEDAIQQLVAIATLMPVVASVGGNAGNQTVALVVRGLALDQVSRENVRYLALKEVGISAINGTLWGAVLGVLTFGLYAEPMLALVVGVATLLNLLVAAIVGVGVPLGLDRLGRDPAMGASVLLTFTTDSMGFLIFLGLASAFVVG